LAKVTKGKVKLKTHKGAAKRFKITGSGKIMRHHSFARHILTSKASKRKRRLAKAVELSPANEGQVRRMLPYGN
jgi:large subunit ribosomal protein L35